MLPFHGNHGEKGGTYAREHDELPQYRASHKANIACRDAIRDNYRDNCLGHDAAKQVIAEFGFDRTLYVLANTVREKDWDGRIDHRNKDWARTIPVFEDENGFGDNRNREFVVDKAHPGLLDLFVTQARREYTLSQPLPREEIHMEAARILSKLQDPREPNSPNGTHFMAQISPDFLLRAGTKEQDKLFVMLPFSGMKDRKGLFATISKDENRNQPLREMVSLLRRTSNNVNQLAKRMNETGGVYAADMDDILQNQERLWQAASEILTRLAAIK
ncbi:MAG: DUF3849 domain-containing protein [Sphaerochaetaceae bacterium]|nr:DUF3849 domain-containing protein [Sphaerochaetaceae bacterium]MDD3162494.1 DUF3849 domain-containing protein [Sphaerochaetaceae bacterium]MDD4006822.1 DUF3849 domain-containing protein [Sphaerochaetaceae bacterium]MDD4396270.1 DUF3849 domain-containing protein [Sphaerochaetaceae bacterium]